MNPTRMLALLCGSAAMIASPLAVAQNDILPRPTPHFEGKIGMTLSDSIPSYPEPVRAPTGAPNVLLVLLDDVGFAQFGTFGGLIPTPGLDRIAQDGLKYTQFHTTALCSPTRASLLTGRNASEVGAATVQESATGFPGNNGIIPKEAGTIGQILQMNGYSTGWFGKDHNVPVWESSAAGPFTQWPMQLGFDYFYGFIGGETDQWAPALWENNRPITSGTNGKLLNTLLVDRAISWIREQRSIAPQKPFFAYVAPGATHSPHHASPEWIAKFKGKFDMGWDRYRELAYDRQKKMGIIPPDTKLTPRPAELPAWDSLNADEKRLYSRMMEVFAAFTAETDHELDRLTRSLDEIGERENTLIIYIVGDNGASAEGGLTGMVNEMALYNWVEPDFQENLNAIDELGGPMHLNHFPAAWGWAVNAPFQWTKQVASHFGGTRNPLVISWPSRIKDRGGIRSQFHHVVDIMPTILSAAGIAEPKFINGAPQMPVDGVSMTYTFPKENAAAPGHRHTQIFEMLANRAIYHDGWIASSRFSTPWKFGQQNYKSLEEAPWELYNIESDFSQANDLAVRYPQKLRELQNLWWAEAGRTQVLPIDWRRNERFDVSLRPSLVTGRHKFTYYPGMIRLPEGAAPDLKNRSFQIRAQVDIPEGGGNGVLVTQGGRFGGYALYVKEGRVTYVHNLGQRTISTVQAGTPLSSGKHEIMLDFKYDGGGNGKGGMATLSADGRQIASGRIAATIPLIVGFETFDVGLDTGTPVVEDYAVPFAFDGDLKKIEIEVEDK